MSDESNAFEKFCDRAMKPERNKTAGQGLLEAKCEQLEARIRDLEEALQAAYELNHQLARELSADE